MARTVLTVSQQDRFSLLRTSVTAPVAMDVANGNVCGNDGSTELEFTLTGGIARTVTLAVPGNVDFDLTSPVRTYSLPANDTYRTGPFPVDVYGPTLLLNASGAGVAVRAITLLTPNG